MSLCFLVRSSSVGECGLLVGAPFTESSRPLDSSFGLLVAFGFTLPLTTVGMELLLGGDGAFAGPAFSVRGDKLKTGSVLIMHIFDICFLHTYPTKMPSLFTEITLLSYSNHSLAFNMIYKYTCREKRTR